MFSKYMQYLYTEYRYTIDGVYYRVPVSPCLGEMSSLGWDSRVRCRSPRLGQSGHPGKPGLYTEQSRHFKQVFHADTDEASFLFFSSSLVGHSVTKAQTRDCRTASKRNDEPNEPSQALTLLTVFQVPYLRFHMLGNASQYLRPNDGMTSKCKIITKKKIKKIKLKKNKYLIFCSNFY